MLADCIGKRMRAYLRRLAIEPLPLQRDETLVLTLEASVTSTDLEDAGTANPYDGREYNQMIEKLRRQHVGDGLVMVHLPDGPSHSLHDAPQAVRRRAAAED